MKKFALISLALIVLCTFIFIQKHSIEKGEVTRGDGLLEPVVGDKDNPDAAYRFRYAILAGKEQEISLPQLRREAINYTKQSMVQSKGWEKTSSSFWSALGPGNIGGRVRSIVISPSNSSILLAGSVSGGIWKTTNGGASWSPKTDAVGILSIGSMVIDPTNSGVVYAGTGEGWANVDAIYGGGIYKSTDFGDTWTLLSSTIGASITHFGNIMKLAADPSGNIYAATRDVKLGYGPTSSSTSGGLYKSSDGGTSWTAINSANVATNYFRPTDILPISSSVILFAVNASGATLGGIYRTTNGGTNWNLVSSNLPTSNYRRISFAQDPNNANTVLAVFESTDLTTSGDAGLKGLYRSTDAGATWIQLTAPPKIASTGSMSYLGAQGWYDNVIAIDPNNSSTIYVGGIDLMKSTNGGTSWSHLSYWDSYYGTPVVHADHHAIVLDASHPNTIFNGNDGGIYKSTNGGTSWTSLNNGLEITQFYGGAVYKTGSTYSGGTQDNGHLKYGGSGTSWTEVYGGDGGYAAQDQSNSSVSYEEYVYLAISKTTNAGATWNDCVTGLTDANDDTKCLFIAPFVINPENSAVLIAGSTSVWVTANSAGNWTQSSNVLSSGVIVSAVAVVNSAANYLGFTGMTNGKIFKCTSLNPASGIDTWTEITPSGNNGGYVRRVVVDLKNKNNIYATYGGYNTSGTLTSRHVWYSTNQGTSWTDISGNLPNVPVHTLVINPVSSSTLYAGTETGVYSTTNNGGTWSSFNSGMPLYVPTDELVLQASTNVLFAFTHGRSAWSSGSNPVPVELTSFIVASHGSNAALKWETATESNNYGFDVERKTIALTSALRDGGNGFVGDFEKIGFVVGAGTSSAPREYSFTDVNIPAGKYSYRLKQIDRDGQFKFSESVDIGVNAFPKIFGMEQNFPNPFNPSTTIRYEVPIRSHVSLSVFNTLGEKVVTLVNQNKEPGEFNVAFNAARLASGVYLYRMDAGSFSETKKLVVMK